MTIEKIELLHKLGRLRKQDHLDGYSNISSFHDGKYDQQPWVSPWTISACNADADLMLIAQDWTSENRIRKPAFNSEMARLGQEPTLPTNKRIAQFLIRHFSLNFNNTFSTNLFVFIKPGEMGSAIPQSDLDYCARKYTIPQVDIVKPRMIICLGGAVSNSLRRALAHPTATLDELKSAPVKYKDSEVYFTHHPGGRGLANAGGLKAADQHWQWLGRKYKSLLE